MDHATRAQGSITARPLPARLRCDGPAQDAWVLIPADNPEAHDAWIWRAQPGTKTQKQCESEVKEYRALDPDKQLLDPAGRRYRIEYHCVPETVDPRGGRAN